MAIPALSTWMTLPRIFDAENDAQEFVESEVSTFGPFVAPKPIPDIVELVRRQFGRQAAASIRITVH